MNCYNPAKGTEASIKLRVTIFLIVLIAALVVCAVLTHRSKRSIAPVVRLLLLALIPPMLGNLDIILSSDWLVSRIGCYVYFIGLDVTVLVLLRFTVEYCSIPYVGTAWRKLVWVLVVVDIVQLLVNPITGHAFTTTEIMVEGSPYYQLVPLAGQVFHRIVAYGIFFASLGVFAYKTATAARIYMERYAVILTSMVICGLWETYYIFSGAPIDRSMIGYGFFGLLVYFFALHYRPVRLLDRMLVRMVSELKAGVFFFDTDGSCIYANEEARRLIALAPDQALPEDAAASIGVAVGGWSGLFNQDWSDLRAVGPDGDESYLDVVVQQIYDKRARHVGASMTVRDVTDEQRRLQREKHLATHDMLTGLYNSRYLYERARALIDANPDVHYQVVAVDIKDFKILNDIFDKEFGDEVLCALAGEMRNLSAPGEVFGRISGDKFGFVIPAHLFSAERMEALLQDYSFGKRVANYPIVVHVGVYDVIDAGLDISVMFDRAFMAISSIKSDYNRHVAIYDDTMRDDLIWSQSISAQLDTAISERQIRPYLQPMVDANGDVEGAEVLVRWIHPEEGFLSPARFIPVFEKNGMIAQLDAYMWECACQILKEWERAGSDLFLSVNISPKDFFFIDVFQTVTDLVEKYQVDPRKLRLEITETVMMTDLENRLQIIERLRGRGFLVEMDDFGSGYSSLNLLKDIPVDVLKIDMMFLYKTKDQARAETILQSIINLSGQLGIPSVTEGVETADQLSMLVSMGCNLFQGYYFAKPMPVSEFEERYRAA